MHDVERYRTPQSRTVPGFRRPNRTRCERIDRARCGIAAHDATARDMDWQPACCACTGWTGSPRRNHARCGAVPQVPTTHDVEQQSSFRLIAMWGPSARAAQHALGVRAPNTHAILLWPSLPPPPPSPPPVLASHADNSVQFTAKRRGGGGMGTSNTETQLDRAKTQRGAKSPTEAHLGSTTLPLC
jgi:hypothetical protein